MYTHPHVRTQSDLLGETTHSLQLLKYSCCPDNMFSFFIIISSHTNFFLTHTVFRKNMLIDLYLMTTKCYKIIGMPVKSPKCVCTCCINLCCELVFHQSRLILQAWQYRGRSLSANSEASAYSAGKQWCSAPLRPLIFTHRHQRPTRAIG